MLKLLAVPPVVIPRRDTVVPWHTVSGTVADTLKRGLTTIVLVCVVTSPAEEVREAVIV